MASTNPRGEVPDVNVNSSQGVQHGSGNTQNNHWMPKPPLDPAVMGALNPHVAVAQLQELDHRELVNFFARAQPRDVAEILEVFSEMDRGRLVATLGDISRRKATELIESVHVPRAGKTISGQLLTQLLNELPAASEAIARKAARLEWADAEPLEASVEGYTRRYDNGHVCWAPSVGGTTTTGAIDDYYWAEGGPDWGFPVKDQKPAPKSPYGTTGVRQEFQAGAAYSSEHGVFLISDDKCYQSEGGSSGWLGFPVSEMQRSEQPGERQMFEGGAIYSYVVEGPDILRSFAVSRKVMSFLPDQGWRPVSKVTYTVSSSGTPSGVQHFEVGLESGNCATVVYSSKGSGTALVAPKIWEYYSKLGAEKSWLGLPTTRAVSPPSGVVRQRFEEGTIYLRSKSSPIAVRKAVDDYIFQDHDLLKRLGFPVTEEQPVGTGESDSIQFFQGGVVTCRDGKYEVWVRPSPKPDPDLNWDSKLEPSVEPDTTAIPEDTPDLPLEDYDKLTVTSLSARLRDLPVERLNQLIEYEKSHAGRPDVIAMFEHHRPPEPYRRGRYFQPRPQQED